MLSRIATRSLEVSKMDPPAAARKHAARRETRI
jgi:hypothetical protein